MDKNDQEFTFQVHPIGQVRRANGQTHVEILEPFRPGLKQLEHFSHVMVFWWADKFDTEEYRTMMQCQPPYAEEKITGVFATRSPYRPNPIAMTTCKLLDVDEENGIVRIADIDAFDGTQVIDLKAYFPVCDRVKTARAGRVRAGVAGTGGRDPGGCAPSPGSTGTPSRKNSPATRPPRTSADRDRTTSRTPPPRTATSSAPSWPPPGPGRPPGTR